MRLVLHFQPRLLLGLFSLVTAVTVVSTPAQAEPPPRGASPCGNGYCDAWADEDAKTCPADCATGEARYAPPPPAPPPRVLAWNEGQAIPPGYHKAKTGTGLIIGGAATFGTAWIPSAVLGSFGIPLLAVPVVGPIYLGVAGIGKGGGGPFLSFAFILDGLQQALGIGMFIGGFASRRTVLVHDDVATAKPRLFPVPMSFGKGSAGLGLVGTM
jgi:hypothetical protein